MVILDDDTCFDSLRPKGARGEGWGRLCGGRALLSPTALSLSLSLSLYRGSNQPKGNPSERALLPFSLSRVLASSPPFPTILHR